MVFLLDEQMSPWLVKRLVAAGHQASHVSDHLGDGAPDREIWSLAGRLRAALITKDEDFIIWARRPSDCRGVLWIRCGNVSNDGLWQRLEPALPAAVAAFERAQRIVEFR
ncbi:MAG: DUF5615 family PIN-like protein [Beijerinckiaceae bacterium]|nr:DUF5615 family PIN-like protein [Beijerinckiaceae bacterium]